MSDATAPAPAPEPEQELPGLGPAQVALEAHLASVGGGFKEKFEAIPGAIIAGSYPLSFVCDGSFTPGDIDVWIPAKGQTFEIPLPDPLEMADARFGKEEGLSEEQDTSRVQTQRRMWRAEGEAEDLAAYMPLKILKIDEEKFGTTSVQFIYIDDDDMPKYIQEHFDLDICMTWWDKACLNVPHHAAIVAREATVVRILPRTEQRIPKYVHRGFRVALASDCTVFNDALADARYEGMLAEQKRQMDLIRAAVEKVKAENAESDKFSLRKIAAYYGEKEGISVQQFLEKKIDELKAAVSGGNEALAKQLKAYEEELEKLKNSDNPFDQYDPPVAAPAPGCHFKESLASKFVQQHPLPEEDTEVGFSWLHDGTEWTDVRDSIRNAANDCATALAKTRHEACPRAQIEDAIKYTYQSIVDARYRMYFLHKAATGRSVVHSDIDMWRDDDPTVPGRSTVKESNSAADVEFLHKFAAKEFAAHVAEADPAPAPAPAPKYMTWDTKLDDLPYFRPDGHASVEDGDCCFDLDDYDFGRKQGVSVDTDQEKRRFRTIAAFNQLKKKYDSGGLGSKRAASRHLWGLTHARLAPDPVCTHVPVDIGLPQQLDDFLTKDMFGYLLANRAKSAAAPAVPGRPTQAVGAPPTDFSKHIRFSISFSMCPPLIAEYLDTATPEVVPVEPDCLVAACHSFNSAVNSNGYGATSAAPADVPTLEAALQVFFFCASVCEKEGVSLPEQLQGLVNAALEYVEADSDMIDTELKKEPPVTKKKAAFLTPKKSKKKVVEKKTFGKLIQEKLAGGAKMRVIEIFEACSDAEIKHVSPNGKTPKNTMDRQCQKMVQSGILDREKMDRGDGLMVWHYFLADAEDTDGTSVSEDPDDDAAAAAPAKKDPVFKPDPNDDSDADEPKGVPLSDILPLPKDRLLVAPFCEATRSDGTPCTHYVDISGEGPYCWIHQHPEGMGDVPVLKMGREPSVGSRDEDSDSDDFSDADDDDADGSDDSLGVVKFQFTTFQNVMDDVKQAKALEKAAAAFAPLSPRSQKIAAATPEELAEECTEMLHDRAIRHKPITPAMKQLTDKLDDERLRALLRAIHKKEIGDEKNSSYSGALFSVYLLADKRGINDVVTAKDLAIAGFSDIFDRAHLARLVAVTENKLSAVEDKLQGAFNSVTSYKNKMQKMEAEKKKILMRAKNDLAQQELALRAQYVNDYQDLIDEEAERQSEAARAEAYKDAARAREGAQMTVERVKEKMADAQKRFLASKQKVQDLKVELVAAKKEIARLEAAANLRGGAAVAAPAVEPKKKGKKGKKGKGKKKK